MQVGQLPGVLLQVGQHDLEVGGHHLQHSDPLVDDRLDEPLDVQDHLLLDDHRAATDHQRRDQLPQRDVEALRRDLADDLPLADLTGVDLGVEMVEHPRLLTHRALRLTRGTGGEVDVGQLIRCHSDAEVTVCVVLGVGGVDEQRLHTRQRLDRLVQGGGAPGLGQHQPALGTRDRRRDPIGGKVRLDRQVGTTGLEHRQNRGHPVQVPLGHHRHDVLAAQPPRQQRPPQPVGPRVELPVGPLPATVHRRDRVRIGLHPLLEQLVEPVGRQLTPLPDQILELVARLLRRQQTLPPVLGIRIRDDQAQRGEVVARDPGRVVRIEHIGAVPQPQRPSAGPPSDSHPQHRVLGELATGTGRIEHGLEGSAGQAQLLPEVVDGEAPVRQQS